MNDKALKQGWNNNDRILEDTFESLVGAIYLDQGMFVAIQFVMHMLHKYVNFEDMMKDTNYKDILMRYAQNKGLALPTYVVSNEYGPNHNKQFNIQVWIHDNFVAEGVARSKKQAEQNAAYNAIQHLQIPT
jgi:ribonuclease-3